MKKLMVLIMVIAIAFAYAVPGFAANNDPVKYTGNVVTGSVKTVGEAAEGTAKTAVSPIEAFWNFLTGKDKGDKVVTDPINKGGKTIYDASVNTGKTITGQKR